MLQLKLTQKGLEIMRFLPIFPGEEIGIKIGIERMRELLLNSHTFLNSKLEIQL